MNAFDYFFEYTKNLEKELVLNSPEPVSYKKIYDDCLSLSNYLKNLENKHNKILIISENSIFFIKAYLAILKSGNIAVPVNPNIEIENLQYILSKCDFKIVFISDQCKALVNNFSGMIVSQQLMNFITKRKIRQHTTETLFDDTSPAEIIFTSGSTGKPKGVILSHKNLKANTGSIISYLQLKHDDIIQVVLPFHYCYGLSLLHTHLRVGGSLVLTNSFIFIGGVINDLVMYRCTGFAGVPSHFQILLRKTKDFKNTRFPDLRYVTQAGGKLHDAFINEFITAFPQVNFYVMYGQTEATARLSYLPPQLIQKRTGSIGKGIPGVQLMVVDCAGNPLAEGEIGEIIAKGDNIMLGYLDDEELTNATVRNSWLYTGDLGKTDEDGYIYVTGRKKDFVKVGGNRISPKEIESVILQIPEVIDCKIVPIEDEVMGESLKAELLVTDKTITIASIKEYCATRLALFKIPKVIEIKTEYKLNISGKKLTTA